MITKKELSKAVKSSVLKSTKSFGGGMPHLISPHAKKSVEAFEQRLSRIAKNAQKWPPTPLEISSGHR